MLTAYRSVIYGKVLRYATGLNPISKTARVVVKIDNGIIQIPVDKRQVKFIAKEYPKGIKAELEFVNGWHIKSQMTPSESNITIQAQDIFLTSP